MLIARLFEPAESDVLYHYCSAEAFLSIAESGRMRFSDINMLNDTAEFRWGYSVLEEAAGECLKIANTNPAFKNLDRDFLDRVDALIGPMQNSMHPFVACFSTEGDLLSQWRAYADGGRGVAIGFRASALKAMPVSLLAVEYERAKQVEEMKTALGACFMENEDDGRKFGSKFYESCIMVGSYMTAFKNPTFKEEREVRCLHLVNVEMSKHLVRFVDRGGVANGKEVDGEAVRFRSQSGAIIAYVDIPFRTKCELSPIKEVLMGPTNPNGYGNILYFLGQLGYEDVTVRWSESTYR